MKERPIVNTESSGGQHPKYHHHALIRIILGLGPFQELVHFIIINLFDQSGVRIWNRVRGRLKLIILRLNINITVINDMMIKYPHDSQKYRTGFGRICLGFEVN